MKKTITEIVFETQEGEDLHLQYLSDGRVTLTSRCVTITSTELAIIMQAIQEMEAQNKPQPEEHFLG